MRVRIEKGLSCLLLLALLLSLLPGLSAAAWAEGIEELELELVEITEQEPEEPPAQESAEEPAAEEPPEPPEEPAAEQTPAEALPEPADGGTEDAGTESWEEELFLEDLDTFEAPAEPEIRLYARAALDENFTLSLYIALPDGEDPAQYQVKTVYEAQLSECVIDRRLSAEDLKDGLYVVADIAEARPYQLTAPVDITVSRGGTVLRHVVYSVRDYLIQMMLADPSCKTFCTAALCYGGAAQRWLEGLSFTWEDEELAFEVYPEDQADKGLTAPDPARPVRDTVYAGTLPGLGAVAARFQIGPETALRFYFQCPAEGATAIDANEKYPVSAPAVLADGVWYADMSGIMATELANDFVLTVTLQNQTMQLLYSPYCYAAQNWNSSDTELAALCHMLVAWGNEAAAMAAKVKEEVTT